MAKATKKSTENPAWDKRVGEFAKATSQDLNKINSALENIVGKPSDDALVILANEEAVPTTDLKSAMESLKIPSGVFNMAVKILRGPKKEVTKEASATVSSLSILPSVPAEESFMKSLVTGGVSKVDSTVVLSAVKAALAKKVGLFDLPKQLADKMESHSLSQDEPVGESFFEMEKLLTAAKYGDVLKAMGVSGKFVSEPRKRDFFARVDNKLWGAIAEFHQQLESWYQSWVQQGLNPNAMMMMMAASKSNADVPPGLMSAPDTSILYSASEKFADTVNAVFAGTGIPVAKALAYDATRIMKILENKDLPVQVGSSSKDQMLKELGIKVGSDMARVETSLTRYVLGIMSVSKVEKEAELTYFGALMQLGNSIPWQSVGISNLKSGIGANSL